MLRSNFLLKHILEKENSEITDHVSYKGTETFSKRKKMHKFLSVSFERQRLLFYNRISFFMNRATIAINAS